MADGIMYLYPINFFYPKLFYCILFVSSFYEAFPSVENHISVSHSYLGMLFNSHIVLEVYIFVSQCNSFVFCFSANVLMFVKVL